ncbi:MAG: PhoH family protein [Bacteroidales bacterium]|nr:PhoH family protein [Bacteroidales bacterium]
MIEKVILLEQADPVIFYGVNNSNILLLKTLYPKLRFAARGRAIKVYGDEADIDMFEAFVNKLLTYCNEYNKLNEEVILDFWNGEGPVVKKQDSLIIYGVNGKPITARTENQRKLVDAFHQNDLVFALGPAGSGKTYVAIALAVRALKNKEIRKIILSRPAVEAGEKLGFLPGEMKDKLDPYLQPLYDALEDMIPSAKLKELMETNVIQIAPLAYMRGRTLSDAIIILDEAQNTTAPQIKMFLTRLGLGARMIVTGDMSQIDLPRNVTSGLVQAQRILRNIPGIATIEFDKHDIVRHRLVQKIVDAYDRFEEQRRKMEEEKKKMHIINYNDSEE